MKKDFAGILKKLDADIIGLQEIKAKPEQILDETTLLESL